jgi:uncharacterized protein
MADIIAHQICDKIAEIETKHDVTVLYACEAGSRAWGFASPDSDYDVRFIYVPRLDYYLNVHVPGIPGQPVAFEPRDVIEVPINSDLDITGWELRKALRLAWQSNPALLEWLSSPIRYWTSMHLSELRDISFKCMRPEKLYHHYLGMATRNYHEHLKGDEVRYKKYLYVLRPLLACRWVSLNMTEGRNPMPPVDFKTLMDATLFDERVKGEIQRLLDIKMASSEARQSAPWPILQRFILDEIVHARENFPLGITPQPPSSDVNLNQFMMNVVSQYDRP